MYQIKSINFCNDYYSKNLDNIYGLDWNRMDSKSKDYRELYLNQMWSCKKDLQTVVKDYSYCVSLRNTFLDSDYLQRDVAFDRCLDLYLTDTETVSSCNFRYYISKDYLLKYGCLSKIGYSKDIDFCYDDYIYGVKPGKT